MAAEAFWKLAVRRAIKAGGGIEAVAAALNLSTSTVGRWNNINDETLPNRAHRIELDELSMLCGGRAHILEAQATQLGHVAFCLPAGFGGCEAATMQLSEATAQFGDIAREMVAALSDGRIDAGEEACIAARIDATLASLVRLRAIVVDDESLIPGVRAA